MIFTFLFLSFLVDCANFQAQEADETIEQCVKEVAKTARDRPPGNKKRPTVDPKSCHDLDADSCTLFNLRDAPGYIINLINNP